MNVNSESTDKLKRKKALRKWAWYSFFWTMALIACIDGVGGIFRYYGPESWVRILLTLLPILPLSVLFRLYWKLLGEEDELERHITRDAFVFAFFATLGVFICTDLLRDAGVLSDFVWKTRSLFYVMIVTLAVSHSVSAWRFR